MKIRPGGQSQKASPFLQNPPGKPPPGGFCLCGAGLAHDYHDKPLPNALCDACFAPLGYPVAPRPWHVMIKQFCRRLIWVLVAALPLAWTSTPASAAGHCIHAWAKPGTYIVSGNFWFGSECIRPYLSHQRLPRCHSPARRVHRRPVGARGPSHDSASRCTGKSGCSTPAGATATASFPGATGRSASPCNASSPLPTAVEEATELRFTFSDGS